MKNEPGLFCRTLLPAPRRFALAILTYTGVKEFCPTLASWQSGSDVGGPLGMECAPIGLAQW